MTSGVAAEIVEREGSVNYAVLDHALWTQLRAAKDPDDFTQAWLALQCRSIEGVVAGVVVLGEPDIGPFAPIAFWPEPNVAGPDLAGAAEQAIEQRQGIVAAHPNGNRSFAAPLLVDGRLYGVCAILVAHSPAPANAVMRQLQWGAAWLETLFRREQATAGAERQERAATVFDLLATVLEHRRFHAATTALATELARRMDCDPVSIGFVRGRRCRVEAISHAASFSSRMNLISDIGAAMDEAVDQRALVAHPAREGWDYRVTLAHADLASAHRAGAVLTVPLQAEGKIIGAITLERPPGREFDASSIELCDAVASVLGPILAEKRANDRLLPVKVAESVTEQLRRLLGPGYFGRKLATLAAMVLVAVFSVAKGDYVVTAPAVVEGRIQRTLVAPFNGYVATEHVRAGETVKRDQVLATLDDQDMVLERLRLLTTIRQRGTEYSRALAKSERAEANIIRSQIDQANAQLALVEEQLTRTRVLAPFDGVVVSGDLSQRVGGALERGQELFRITPLSAYRVILEIDERDIRDVKVGQRGAMVVTSLPDTPLRYQVERITPIAEQSEGRNFFRVEAHLDEAGDRLRPSMKGVGKTDVEPRLLIDIWTRKFIEWARLAVWRWLP